MNMFINYETFTIHYAIDTLVNAVKIIYSLH